jgi:hypothetical protein
MVRSPASQRVPLRQKLLLMIISVFGTLLVLEIGLRSFDAARGYGFLTARRSELATPLRPTRPFRGYGYDYYQVRDGTTFISSRHGELYPFEKPDGTVRIVVFGGSTTVNARAFGEAGVHYPLLLERRLRSRSDKPVEVINVANSGYATPQALTVLSLDVLSWAPDVVILSHNVNDRHAQYWDDFQLDYSHVYSHPFFSVPDYRSRYTLANILFQHSQLYWLLKDRIRGLTSPTYPPLERRSYGMVPTAAAVEVFERNLKSFADVALANGIEVLFASQALEPSEEFFCLQLCEQPFNDVVAYPLHDEILAHHAYYNGVIERVAAEKGLWFLDNEAFLGGRREYFVDHVHYSVRGVEALADNYANFLVDQGIVQ